MNDRQLKSFIAIIETGSFSMAEQIVFVSRQALKKQIDTLEDELGFPLIRRTARGAVPTEAGQRFYEGVRKLTADMDELIASCQHIAIHKDTLRIGVPQHPRLLLEDAFREFSTRCPEIKLDVVFLEKANGLELLTDDAVDMAECTLPDDFAQEGIKYLPLADLRYYCVMSERYPLAGRQLLTFQDLSSNVIGLRGNHNGALIAQLRERCQDVTIIETTGNEMQQMIRLCANQCIFISRAWYARTFEPLVSIPLETELRTQACLFYRAKHGKTVEKFLQVVKELYPLKDE